MDNWNHRSAVLYSLRYIIKFAMLPAISLPFLGLCARHHKNSSIASVGFPAFNHAKARRL